MVCGTRVLHEKWKPRGLLELYFCFRRTQGLRAFPGRWVGAHIMKLENCIFYGMWDEVLIGWVMIITSFLFSEMDLAFRAWD